MPNTKSTEKLDHTPNSEIGGWLLLKNQAEYDLKIASEKVKKLKAAIKSFKRSAEAGTPFPGQSAP